MAKRKSMQLRLPEDLKKWIESQAVRNGCSQNSEIVRAVRDRMEQAEQAQGV